MTRDPGAQPERTRLAWRRTTLSFALVVALAGRGVATAEGARGAGALLVATTALLWVAFLALAHHRIRTLTAHRQPPPAGATVPAATAVVAATALCAGALLAGPW
ncbi:DUF202 domain-containing protein [Streptomyces sp. MP131-18]|uniref:DUF202 domain-containing protein n=1 Tax=Streptomyces sp. MP131-18 TaxID=1857892 RepID=UPI00097C22A6|nr:DUF202 domain-containing protein [Streptomyces sp. MP131-18]ONK15410.1 hypothetical protein STBA_62260 [Streptomyces sp. MP131-18]